MQKCASACFGHRPLSDAVLGRLCGKKKGMIVAIACSSFLPFVSLYLGNLLSFVFNQRYKNELALQCLLFAAVKSCTRILVAAALSRYFSSPFPGRRANAVQCFLS